MPGFAGQDTSRPDLPVFYATLATVRAAVKPRCDALEVRRLDMLLDVACQTQQQIDCDGYLFRGRKRFMELMFSDDQLAWMGAFFIAGYCRSSPRTHVSGTMVL